MSSLPNRPASFRPFPSLLIYPLIAFAITILPLLLWRWNPVFIRNTYGEAYEPFELFGFWAATAVLGHTIWSLRREKPPTWPRLLPILIPAGLLLHFLNLITEYSIPSWDYNCYQSAASALLAGSNPYADCYLYPPLLAETIAAVHQIILGLAFISEGQESTSWTIAYYLFQCVQFFAIALAYPLAYRFARRLGFEKMTAVFLVAALLLINTPLLRTIRHTQVNLIVLDLFLVGLLLADRFPLLSGLSTAFGIHLKLYPAVLFLPWLLTRRWRTILFGLAGLLILILVSASWGQDWRVWEQFISASETFPPGNQFRDNSLQSLVSNGIGFIAVPTGMTGNTYRTIVSVIILVLSVALTGWVGWRIFKRYQATSNEARSDKPYYFAQAMDSLALALMLAPRVWEHHYVLTVPIALWGTAVAGKNRPWLVGTAAFLMLGLPTFDIYPLSYHRLAGLLLMLYLTRPTNRPIRRDNITLDNEPL